MQYIQSQIDLANETNLVAFLLAQGEEVIKSGREYRWKAHDSVCINNNQWFQHSQNKGGYPVDFVMNFYGLSFSEAVETLLNMKGVFMTEDNKTNNINEQVDVLTSAEEFFEIPFDYDELEKKEFAFPPAAENNDIITLKESLPLSAQHSYSPLHPFPLLLTT